MGAITAYGITAILRAIIITYAGSYSFVTHQVEDFVHFTL